MSTTQFIAWTTSGPPQVARFGQPLPLYLVRARIYAELPSMLPHRFTSRLWAEHRLTVLRTCYVGWTTAVSKKRRKSTGLGIVTWTTWAGQCHLKCIFQNFCGSSDSAQQFGKGLSR